jgi:hypothetical protein
VSIALLTDPGTTDDACDEFFAVVFVTSTVESAAELLRLIEFFRID